MDAIELLQKSIDTTADKVSELAEKISGMGATVTEQVKGDFDEKFREINDLKSDFLDLQQKFVAQKSDNAQQKFKSVGEEFAMSYKNNQGKMQVKSITSDDVGRSVYSWGGVASDRIRWSLFDLIPVSHINDTAIEYMRTIGLDNKSRPVDEAKMKPHSHLSTHRATATLRTVAHYEMVTRQALKADAELKNTINNELYNGLILSAEFQAINGRGEVVTDTVTSETYTEWDGLLKNSTALDDSNIPTDANLIDKIRFAMAQIITGAGWADGVILNPLDWAKIETAKINTNGSGAYLIGNPIDGSARRTLWGLPVVDTQSIRVGKFVVGAFKTAARIFLQNDGIVFIDGYVNDQLIRNELTIVAELMGNVGVKKPAQIISGNFV